MKQLWLDDIHAPSASPVELTGEVYWLKNGEGFIDLIDSMVEDGSHVDVDHISLDNDLGDEEATTGVQCFNYLEASLYEGYFPNLSTIVVHSDNSAAVSTMLSASSQFKSKYGIVITRKRRIIN